MGKSLLEEHGEIDYLCVGEGESMVVEFLDKFGTEELYNVENLAYRRNGEVYQNPIRPPENLADIPPFPWHFFSPKSVVQEGLGFLYVNASRGCPYRCSYCGNTVYLSHYGKNYIRYRPVENVIEEMVRLKEIYHPRLFYFGDEMILNNPEYWEKLFTSVKKRIDIPYGFQARVEQIDQKTVDFLFDTGCRYIAMGIECGNEEFRRKHLNRSMSNEQIEQAFALVKSKGIFTTSFNMIGFPFDNDAMLTEDTVKLNQKIKPDYAYILIYYPFPGTELHQRCVDLDLIDKKKVNITWNFFSESILKGVCLGDRKNEIYWLLNPNDLYVTLDGEEKKDTLPFYLRFKRAAYTSSGIYGRFLKLILSAVVRVKRLLKIHLSVKN